MTNLNPAVVLATALLTVAQMNEDSFDEGTGLYGLSTEEAADQLFGADIASNTLHRPVTTLLALDWNGSVEWATRIIEAYQPGEAEVAAA